jgi:hypothetical protein
MDYGRYSLPNDTLRVVATRAQVGRRKDRYVQPTFSANHILISD